MIEAALSKSEVDPNFLLSLFRNLLRLRLIEEAIAAHYPRHEMRCPVHLSVGQEAVAVGTTSAFKRSDRIVSTHRGHAHYLAKGGDLTAMICEIYGKAAGCTGGRGGSMNLCDLDAGVLLTLPLVGSSIPLGVGVALTEKQRGGNGICGVYFGDAALEEGVFHESANFASLKKLPVVFICENNLYAVYTHIAKRQPHRPLIEAARAHGMPAYHEDGNDVLAVYAIARRAVAHARSGKGPVFLVFDTYRWREHCGPNFDNDLGYRAVKEYESWRDRCPLESFRTRLRQKCFLDAGAEAAMTAEIEAEIEAAIKAAKAAPFPAAADAGSFVYA